MHVSGEANNTGQINEDANTDDSIKYTVKIAFI
jgi:hypothetical protein